jgi:hypothetical protein
MDSRVSISAGKGGDIIPLCLSRSWRENKRTAARRTELRERL